MKQIADRSSALLEIEGKGAGQCDRLLRRYARCERCLARDSINNRKKESAMTTIDFKFGTLIRTGPKLVNGGKWDAELNEDVRNAQKNADLTIYISVFFQKIDPAVGKSGTHGDADGKNRAIQKWAPGEFERYTRRLVSGAQRFWTDVFWLKTPDRYTGLNWPDSNPKVRCNVSCKLELEQAKASDAAHYTIAVVRVKDGEPFRSHSRLYSQRDIQPEHMIQRSTAKFWTHFHEVGHLLGLGHVGHGGKHNHVGNEPTAYGVAMLEMQDVMGRGSHRHAWHATPWQEAAATFTSTKPADWVVSMGHGVAHVPTPLRS